MAIHDPTLTLMQALEQGYSRMVLISANAVSSINLGLQYRQDVDRTPAYDYSMQILKSLGHIHIGDSHQSADRWIALGISSVPNLNLICNTASNDYLYPCHTTLFLQLPTLSRTVLTETSAMSWLVSALHVLDR